MCDKPTQSPDTPSRPVIVTTAHRGVFFGYLAGGSETKDKCVLRECRNAIHWLGTRGFLGLASHGPESGSKIGSIAPLVTLYDITSIADVTPEAEKVWRNWP